MACPLNARMSDGGDILRMTVAGANECVDMMQAGISNPTKVERVALQKAVSIASLLLTTEAFTTDIPEAEKVDSSMEHGAES